MVDNIMIGTGGGDRSLQGNWIGRYRCPPSSLKGKGINRFQQGNLDSRHNYRMRRIRIKG
jgi:hypothetical protein